MEGGAVVRRQSLSHNQKKHAVAEESNNIRVVCRFRPEKAKDGLKYNPKAAKAKEKDESSNTFDISEENSSVSILDTFEQRSFTFDKMIGFSGTQAEIFGVVQSTVESILLGFNGTVLAYGQTSSGKTWTMEGPNLDDEEMGGIIPRSIRLIFQLISSTETSTVFTISASYFEVYCERLRDLLNPAQDNMKIRESKENGYSIPDLTEVPCSDVLSVMKVIHTGKANRALAPTLMNAESSRSHSILTILVTQKNESKGVNLRGKLFLVDLAGSEKISKTGATGVRLEEAKNINKSLTTLGMVINALCEGSPHICYRDSKLTRILMDALGGNCKTTLIINCAPEARHLSETLSTLRFGDRAKNIKNKVKVNEELGAEELKRRLVIVTAERDELRIKLESKGINDDIPTNAEHKHEEEQEDHVNEDGMYTTNVNHSSLLDALQTRITDLEEEIDVLHHQNEKLSNEKISLETENDNLKASVVEIETQMVQLKLERNEAFLAIPEKFIFPVDDVPTDLSVAHEGELSVTGDNEDSCFDAGNSSIALDASYEDIERNGGSVSMSELENESKQLCDILDTEMSGSDTKFSNSFAKLKNDYDTHVRRLLSKLAVEQMARSKLEDELEEIHQRDWSKQQLEKKSSSSFGFMKYFSSSRQSGESPMSKRERALSNQIVEFSNKASSLEKELLTITESTKVSLETKEFVVRKLLKENNDLQAEKDALLLKLETSSSAVDHLTSLLRNLQNSSLPVTPTGKSNINGVVINGGALVSPVSPVSP